MRRCRSPGAAAATRRGRHSRRRDHRRRRQLHLSAGLEVVGRLQRQGDRQQGQLPVDRLRRRHRPDQGRHRRLRLPTSRWRRKNWRSRPRQFPSAIGGVVPVVNLEGMQPGQLQAHRRAAGRHLPRQDHHWNDAAIAALNPGVALPADKITSCTAPTVRAPPSTSPTTCPRSARSGRPRSAKAPRSTGRQAWAARATKASPPT
jgi:hypothetical protein